ncbi:hypothetical protein ACFWYW_46630 [Nonomuraea sp. NPDC059023]|uniref:hypothetical protein n=1 Tax=unclassified Nonomuraea TaxID=2593643 RepID=UPI0036BFB5C4
MNRNDQATPANTTVEDEALVPTFLAPTKRTGKFWTANVLGLPDGQHLQIQGKTWAETRDNALERVAELLGSAHDTVGVLLVPEDADEARAVETARAARAARATAEQDEQDVVLKSAELLRSRGWTTRDVGSVLGYSHQRISQIAPEATT